MTIHQFKDCLMHASWSGSTVWQRSRQNSETDGPKVSSPNKYNFGSKLITATLKQMHATLEPNFAETGYCYKISFARD